MKEWTFLSPSALCLDRERDMCHESCVLIKGLGFSNAIRCLAPKLPKEEIWDAVTVLDWGIFRVDFWRVA